MSLSKLVLVSCIRNTFHPSTADPGIGNWSQWVPRSPRRRPARQAWIPGPGVSRMLIRMEQPNLPPCLLAEPSALPSWLQVARASHCTEMLLRSLPLMISLTGSFPRSSKVCFEYVTTHSLSTPLQASTSSTKSDAMVRASFQHDSL